MAAGSIVVTSEDWGRSYYFSGVLHHNKTRPRSSTPSCTSSLAKIFCLMNLLTSFVGALSPPASAGENQEIRLAFIGNSMIYFNDSPRLVENMLRETGYKVRQDSCLRGGATLSSLWERGNGMKECFRSNAALLHPTNETPEYDIGSPTVEALFKGMELSSDSRRQGRNVLVANDHTQSPARVMSRDATATALREHYMPCIYKNLNDPVLILFLQTPAYRYEKIRGTEDLGDFDEFTTRIREGCHFYSAIVQETAREDSSVVESQVAPIGEAYRYLRQQNKELWEKLYSYDDFHPSLHGTWLQACILYALITKEAPPPYQPSWWQSSRYVVNQLPLPTSTEAEELRQAACYIICQRSTNSSL